ncbi:MAG: hypothetical protein BGO67_13050 [Alphaproteobacteria bacterium 41-28]|nr:MAG: hypothetical protein BGO67_13050 [Alphaproteobacteria bacterium 41-28]
MARLQQSLLTLKTDSFGERLRAVAQGVEDGLDKILPPPTTRLHEAMRYSVFGGGKRLRSYFTCESSRLFNVPLQNALQTAAVIELIHAYSLVHDDLPCMDNADMRRGKPSCHKAFGEATATLVGDALIPLAFQTLASLEISPEVRLELIEELGRVIGSQGLVAGQMMDLGQEGPRSTLEDLLEQQHLKTGVLFGFAAEAGGILGKASPDERQALRSYGLLFGKAFQMMDDWLDGCGDEEAIGKPCGQDIEKFTFLNLLDPDSLRKKTEETLQKALNALSPFEGRAYLLEEALVHALPRIS